MVTLPHANGERMEEFMKKIVSILLVCLLVLGIFASCAGNKPQETKTEPTTKGPAESASEAASESASESASETASESASESATESVHEHTYEVKETHDASCTEGGYEISVCTGCGEEMRKDFPALGHLLAGNRHVSDGKTVVTCARCREELEVADSERERLIAIADRIVGERLRITAYGTPDCNSSIIEEQFLKMLDAGINTAVMNGVETSLGLWAVADAANNTGMDVLVDTTPTAINNPEDVVAKMWELDKEPHFVGLYLRDEPYPFWFGNLGKTTEQLRAEYPGAKWCMGANLLGWGNPAYVWKGIWEDGTQEWKSFGKENPDGSPATDANGSLAFGDGMTAEAMHYAMNVYWETVKPDFFCFDVYPYHNQKSGNLPNYLANLAFFQYYALKYDVPMWTFLQTANGPVDGSADPTYTQIRCESNLSLAAGAKSLLCFTVVQTSEWSYMISADGTEFRPIYYDAKNVFTGIHQMKGTYLSYDFDKYIVNSADKNYGKYFTEFEMDGMLTDTYAELASVDGEEIFVGCGKNAEGKTGLYVVNLNYKKNAAPTTATLYLTEELSYRLWGDTEGLEGEGVTDRFLLTLEPGEGCFIELNPAD